nr:unknown [Zea mays]
MSPLALALALGAAAFLARIASSVSTYFCTRFSCIRRCTLTSPSAAMESSLTSSFMSASVRATTSASTTLPPLLTMASSADTLVASLSTSRPMREMDLAARSALSVRRCSRRRLACAAGSSSSTILERSLTPAMSRNALESRSLSLYTSFWSSGCSPVRADSIFFSSPKEAWELM